PGESMGAAARRQDRTGGNVPGAARSAARSLGAAPAGLERRPVRPGVRAPGSRAAHRGLAAVSLRLARAAPYRAHHRAAQAALLVASPGSPTQIAQVFGAAGAERPLQLFRAAVQIAGDPRPVRRWPRVRRDTPRGRRPPRPYPLPPDFWTRSR